MPETALELKDEVAAVGRFERWTERGLLLVVVLASLLAMSPSVADPDLWGHVQYGRDVLAEGRLAETTTYSFTANGYRWINHENLAELSMAWIVDHWGPAGLLWGKLLLAAIVIGTILVFNLRQGTGWIASGIVTLLVAWNLGYHWSFRPQLASFVGFTALVLLLQFCFAGWRDRWHVPWRWTHRWARAERSAGIDYHRLRGRALWLAPVLFAVWANAHGGFVAGLSVYGLYLAVRGLEALLVRGRGGWGLVRRMALMALVAGLATLLNPYSYRLPIWLVESLGQPRPEISDWSSDQLFSMIGAKFWMLIAVTLFALSVSRRSLDLTQMIVIGVVGWQAVAHFRHVPFFAILCGFWLGPHLESALFRLQGQTGAKRWTVGQEFGQRVALVAGWILVVGSLISGLGERLDQVRVDRSQFPVDAFAFLKHHELHGRIVVTYDWAQYAIAAFCTEASGATPSRVAFDGRFRTCYPQSIVDMHFDFLFGQGEGIARHRNPQSPPCDPGRVLRHGHPDLVILRRRGELTERHMKQYGENWVVLYEDGLAQVWGRRDRYDDPASPDYLPPEQRIRRDSMPRGVVAWPAMPTSSDATGPAESGTSTRDKAAELTGTTESTAGSGRTDVVFETHLVKD